MKSLFLVIGVSIVLSGCSILDILKPDPVFCELYPVPTLPASVDGEVVLDTDNQSELLLYINSLEDCVDELQ